MTSRSPLYARDLAGVLSRHRRELAKPAGRRAAEIGLPIAIALSALFSIWWLGLSVERLGTGMVMLGKYIGLMFPPSPGGQLKLFLTGMGETLAIAFLGTLAAALLAAPLSLLAAKNTTPHSGLRFLIRRCLDTIRGIDTLIWALVFVGVVGLGPFAGVLAIAVADFGSFGKLFSEAIEATGARGSETVVASGGSRAMAIRFGLLPEVLPVIASQVLYYFESNTRSAAIIGIVGAGGIGLQLAEQIRTYDFDRVAFIVLMILVVVAAIDWISGKLRFAIIGRRPSV
jgi:phosphonate transport system permease protein